MSRRTRLEEKRASILTEARRVLVKLGTNASMGDIAAATGMDKSSLYYYFKGIPEVLNAILDREYLDFSVELDSYKKARDPAAEPRETLEGMVRMLLEFYYDNLELLEVVLTQISPLFIDPEARHHSRAINHFLDNYNLTSRYFLEEIRQAIGKGQLEPELSPLNVLLTMRGVILGQAALWRTEKPARAEVPGIVERIFRMFPDPGAASLR